MKIRTIEVTIHHAESGWQEVRSLTFWFDASAEQYELTKVYVQELGRTVVFSKGTNEVILPD